jgi:hypothetical protein
MCTRADFFYEWDRGSKFQNEGLKAKNDSSNLRSDGLNTMRTTLLLIHLSQHSTSLDCKQNLCKMP